MGEDQVLLMGLSLIWKTKSTLLLTPINSGFFILKNHKKECQGVLKKIITDKLNILSFI